MRRGYTPAVFAKVSFLVGMLVLVNVTTAVPSFINPGEAADIVVGLVGAVVKKDNLDEIKGCISDTEGLTQDIDSVISELRKGNPAGLTKGLMDTKKLIETLPSTLERCVKVGNMTRFNNFAKIFSKPGELAQRMSYNMMFKFP